MSMAHDNAQEALEALLDELPWFFSEDPKDHENLAMTEFRVIKKSNIRKVHRALWELQEYLDVNQ